MNCNFGKGGSGGAAGSGGRRSASSRMSTARRAVRDSGNSLTRIARRRRAEGTYSRRTRS